MKFRFLTSILLVFVVVLNTSCKKTTDEISIVGKWNVIGIDMHEFYSGTSHYSSNPPNPGAYLELKSDGTLFAVSTSTFSSGTWNKNNSKLTLITNGGVTEEWNVKKLTKTELELYWTDKHLYPNDYVELTVYLKR
jgi:hypothetical protein